MSILIIEDNPVSLKILDINLQENGYEVITAPNPIVAFSKLKENPEINLIITDIMMPEMDGLEFITEIKKNPEWKKLPFIITSAMSNKPTVKKAIEIGCKHFIVKPVKAAQLIKMVRELIPREKLILRDKAHNAKEMGLNLASYQKIAQIFVNFLKDSVEILEKEINEKNFNNISLDTAQLRESTTTLKAERVLEVLSRLNPQDSEPGVWNKEKDYKLLLKELQLLLKAIQLSLN